MQTRVKLLGSTALAAAAMVMGAPAAFADAHASLEKRVKALEKAGGGQTVTRSKKTMNLVVSGHVNRAINFVDNGTTSGVQHVTSNFSRTRVRWIGTGKISDDLSVKTHIELGSSSAISTEQDLADNGDANTSALDERHIEFQITSKSLGKVYIGQGITGSESTSEVDLSGTGLVSLNGAHELAADAERFQTAGVAGVTLGAVFNSFDGAGRRDRIRYDTPKFAGFQVTTSHHNADTWDVALRYGGSWGGVKVKAAIAYADDSSRNGEERVNGSASVLLPFGLSFTVGAAQVDEDRFNGVTDDAEWRYAKIGYKFKALEMGQTRLYVDWNYNEDVRAAGDEATSIGVGVVQILEPLGAELYLSYTNFELEIQNTTDPDDIDVFVAGARFKF